MFRFFMFRRKNFDNHIRHDLADCRKYIVYLGRMSAKMHYRFAILYSLAFSEEIDIFGVAVLTDGGDIFVWHDVFEYAEHDYELIVIEFVVAVE